MVTNQLPDGQKIRTGVPEPDFFPEARLGPYVEQVSPRPLLHEGQARGATPGAAVLLPSHSQPRLSARASPPAVRMAPPTPPANSRSTSGPGPLGSTGHAIRSTTRPPTPTGRGTVGPTPRQAGAAGPDPGACHLSPAPPPRPSPPSAPRPPARSPQPRPRPTRPPQRRGLTAPDPAPPKAPRLTAAGRTVRPAEEPGVGWGKGGGGSKGAGLSLKGAGTATRRPSSTETGEGAGPQACAA